MMSGTVKGMLGAMALLAGGCALAAPGPMPPTTCLVTDGKPVSAIVLDGKATRSAQFAAKELQYHVKMITGADLPVVTAAADVTDAGGVRVFVGESSGTQALGLKSADFADQEYLVRVKDNAIVLMGRDAADTGKVDYGNYQTFPGEFDQRGACYAVYDFLERCCDVRWYLPTELGLVCPKKPTLAVRDVEVRRAPTMKYRWVEIRPEASYAADLCGDTVPGPEEPKMLAPRELKLWLARYRMGGANYACTHSFEGYHDRFLKAHPDWFAKGYAGEPPQPCFTSPGLVNQTIQDARDYFDGKGLKLRGVGMGDFFALEPNDTHDYCKCDACRALLKDKPTRGVDFSTDMGSDYWWGFVRKVADAVGQSHPGKYLSTLAYREHAYPPSGKPLPPNVSVQCCLASRMAYSSELNENHRRILKAWTAGEPRRPIYLWLYYCFPSLSGCMDQFRVFPGFYAHTIVNDMKRYHDAGVRGMFIEPSYLVHRQRSALFDQIEFVVTWKLADDPTLDGDKLIDEFFERYYGKAAGPMRKFYELVEKTYCDPASYPSGFRGHQNEEIAWKWLGTDERMAKLGTLMDQAKAAAETDVEKARVALFDKGVWQYMKKGKEDYLNKEKLLADTMKKERVPRVAAVDGDPLRVDWNKAIMLGDWRNSAGESTKRTINGRIAHDGRYFYLRLEERLDPKTLKVQIPGKLDDRWDDHWEIFFAKQRAKPFRQMLVNAEGRHDDWEFDKEMAVWQSNVKVASETNTPDRWTVSMAFPLADLLPGGVSAGDTIYFNAIRARPDWADPVCWVPIFNAAFQQPSRFGRMTLE